MPYAVTPMTMEYLQDLDYESVVQPATRVFFPLQATFAESDGIFSSPMPSLFQPRPAVSSYFSSGSWTRPSFTDMPSYMLEDPAMQIVKKRRHQSKLDDGKAAAATQTTPEDNLLKPDFRPQSSAKRSYTKNRTSFIEITAFQVPSSPVSRPMSCCSTSSSEREVPIPYTPEPELPDDISPEFSSFSSVSSGTFSNVGDLDDLDDMPGLDAYKIEHLDGCPIKGYLDSENQQTIDYFSSRCNCSRNLDIESKSNDWMNLSWDNSPPMKAGQQYMNTFISGNTKAEPKVFTPGYPDIENMDLCSI
ncbi:hypothetical protein ABW19_dt0205373 [Dactylella cylindrospora]|nr:hypothetical protein ABW19_dt0205373 [Dactylella cylindrospora]